MKPLERMTIVGTAEPGLGIAPAVVLADCKYGKNAASALRACSAYGYGQLWLTGDRWEKDWERRMPREERMKAYQDVDVFRCDQPLRAFGKGITPVAVEVLENAEPMASFIYPENPVFVFGPEDGSIPDGIRRACHRFMILPTEHCLNLGQAVACVLNDQKLQRQRAGLEAIRPSYATLREQRGWADDDSALEWAS